MVSPCPSRATIGCCIYLTEHAQILTLPWRTNAGLVACLLVCRPAVRLYCTATGRETTAASVANYALSADMPVDPEVLVGALPNGLRFYIRPNPKPAREVELRLVVKAGSVLEDDDQRGLAHFVEHMQFQGSKHFPGQSIAAFLSSHRRGHRRGRERPDEFRRHAGHSARARRSSGHPRHGADRARRLGGRRALRTRGHRAPAARSSSPNGDATSAPANGPPRTCAARSWRDRVTRTDPDWDPVGDRDRAARTADAVLSRLVPPDLMAVIVVGDVDKNAVAAMIRQHFSSLVNPEPERPRPIFDVPDVLARATPSSPTRRARTPS